MQQNRERDTRALLDVVLFVFERSENFGDVTLRKARDEYGQMEASLNEIAEKLREWSHLKPQSPSPSEKHTVGENGEVTEGGEKKKRKTRRGKTFSATQWSHRNAQPDRKGGEKESGEMKQVGAERSFSDPVGKVSERKGRRVSSTRAEQVGDFSGDALVCAPRLPRGERGFGSNASRLVQVSDQAESDMCPVGKITENARGGVFGGHELGEFGQPTNFQSQYDQLDPQGSAVVGGEGVGEEMIGGEGDVEVMEEGDAWEETPHTMFNFASPSPSDEAVPMRLGLIERRQIPHEVEAGAQFGRTGSDGRQDDFAEGSDVEAARQTALRSHGDGDVLVKTGRAERKKQKQQEKKERQRQAKHESEMNALREEKSVSADAQVSRQA
mmetsp:Transcript_39821/g.78484  ORF Transcript_39821/g.78484 Transcript_39821/m.78484 type:complete len:384 (+) Transcript_39821:678-1829(+)